ncbi:pentapeptide repeat-containing protein [Micromonospora sp. CA-259024]|uniref:pentapeptide repeat-containing protein n=1 Tax=Micromonospora sp. CA-259024 TaxID=3239965 RepID=UPI003D8D60CC
MPRWASAATEFVSVQTHRPREKLRYAMPVWLRRLVVSLLLLIGASAVTLVIWRGPFWFDAALIDAIQEPEKKAQAVTSARSTLLQIALAFGGLATIIFTARTYLLTKSGQVADRYTKAATQLVSESPAERIGAIYALARLMKDSPRDHRAVVDLLAAFVRQSRPIGTSRASDGDLEVSEGYESELVWVGEPLPIDVQTALTALNKRPKRFESPWIVLKATNLAGAALLQGRVDGLHFEGSNLRGADFVQAKAIKGVVLSECDLRAANLSGAHLPVSHLADSDLRGALIRWVDLRGSLLNGSDLRGAVLRGSNLKDATLCETDLRGVDLSEVKGLTNSQLEDAITDKCTILPDYLKKQKACPQPELASSVLLSASEHRSPEDASSGA